MGDGGFEGLKAMFLCILDGLGLAFLYLGLGDRF